MERRPEIHTITSFHDNRGDLKVFEEGATLNFTPVRCYVISEVPLEETRGGHALSCDEFVAVLHGSVVAVVSNGNGLDEYTLDGRNSGLYVPRNTWFRLERFAPGSIVAIFASAKFYDTVYTNY